MMHIKEASLQTGKRQLKQAAALPLKRAEAKLRSKGKLTYHGSGERGINSIRKHGVLHKPIEGYPGTNRIGAVPGFHTGPKTSAKERVNFLRWWNGGTPAEEYYTKPKSEKFIHPNPVWGGQRLKVSRLNIDSAHGVDSNTENPQFYREHPKVMKRLRKLGKFNKPTISKLVTSLASNDPENWDRREEIETAKRFSGVPGKIKSIPYEYPGEDPDPKLRTPGTALYNRPGGAEVMTHALRQARDQQVLAKRSKLAHHIMQLRIALRKTNDPSKQQRILKALSQVTGRTM